MKCLPAALWVFLSLLPGPLSASAFEEPAFLAEHAALLDRLFRLLDTTQPELAAVQQQWAEGHRSTAAAQLLEHLRQGPSPADVLEPLDWPANLEEQAAAALENRFFILGQWISAKGSDSRVDWHRRGPSGDKETAWMLNRHTILPVLAEWHARSGQPAFAATASALLIDWIRANPYPDRLTFSAPWRALEVARRVLNAWTHLFYQYDCLSPEARLLLLASIPDHADALLEHTSFWGGNHLLTEKLALLLLGMGFPMFAEALHWQSTALAELETLFLAQSYPDGSYTELSNHYQRVVLVNARTFNRLLKGIPSYRPSPATHQRLLDMWDFFAGVTRPDGIGPLNNAGDEEVNAAFLEEVWPEFDRPDWLYIATGGARGVAPEGTPSRLYPWAGQAILRTGFRPQDSWVYFDAGPYGTAHQHADRLHLSAFLEGQPLLVDAGRYTYQPGKWKAYFTGPRSHNVLLLDGQPAVQGPRRLKNPLPLSLKTGPGFAFTESLAHFSPKAFLQPGNTPTVPWARSLLLDDRGFLIVVDFIGLLAPAEVEAIWNFDPERSTAEVDAAISLHSALPARTDSVRGATSPVAGFHSPDYGVRLAAVQTRYRLRASSPTTLVWLVQSPASIQQRDIEVVHQPNGILEITVLGPSGPLSVLHLRHSPRAQFLQYEIY